MIKADIRVKVEVWTDVCKKCRTPKQSAALKRIRDVLEERITENVNEQIRVIIKGSEAMGMSAHALKMSRMLGAESIKK